MSERCSRTPRKRRLRTLPTIRVIESDEVCPPELEAAAHNALLAILRRAFDAEDAAPRDDESSPDTPSKES